MVTRLSAFVGSLCLAGAAFAQVSPWSTPGSTCTPSDLTVRSENYRTGAAWVRHAPSKVGSVVLSCPIARYNFSRSGWTLNITYQDSTGQGTTAFVRARLYRMSTGATTPALLATATSDVSTHTDPGMVASPEFSHSFNFDNNMYWVRVELYRSSTAETVTFYSASLRNPPL